MIGKTAASGRFCHASTSSQTLSVTALSVAGDADATGFAFAGFMPSKGAERQAALQAVLAAPGSQLLFEAPHRIEALARALADAAPGRRVTLCRELTKQFETIVTGPAGDLPAWLAADANRSRGEFVLVLHAVPVVAAVDDGLPADAERLLRPLLRDLPLKQAVALAAELSGAPRNALYQRALALRAADGSAQDAETD
jgi:16S rRNA (cytidine1402-2'-O)-methyltransferase